MAHWQHYELIDCGDFEKLERFGEYILIRPEPQALWPKRLPYDSWKKQAHAHFIREKQVSSYRSGDSSNGGWNFYKSMPQRWEIAYSHDELSFKFKLSLTSFGHIGLFPEQADNWHSVYTILKKEKENKPKVLNLFAYTGGATLACCQAGADVTHLDAVKQVVNWASENATISGMTGARWVVEDAMTYLQREVKRGKKYSGIILDPPAFGRGPNGEKWLLQDMLGELLALCQQIIEPNHSFVLLNLYSLGYSTTIAQNIMESYFPNKKGSYTENVICSSSGLKLPLGISGLSY